MKAIVAIDKLWGIGNNGDLLFHIKEDMEFFRKITTNKVVVMGRNTFESLPNKEPLKNRINLVVTSSNTYESHDNVVFGNLDEINKEIKKYNTNDIFIIGGGAIYKQFIHRCDTVYVTHNTAVYEADTYMPNLAFEGFVFEEMVYRDTDWAIGKWVTSECKPYRSVIWFNDSNNDVIFLYANELYHWKNIYSDNFVIMQDEHDFKNRLVPMIVDIDRITTIEKIHDYYRAEINSSLDYETLRIASFGATEAEAMQDLITTITYILVS